MLSVKGSYNLGMRGRRWYSSVNYLHEYTGLFCKLCRKGDEFGLFSSLELRATSLLPGTDR